MYSQQLISWPLGRVKFPKKTQFWIFGGGFASLLDPKLKNRDLFSKVENTDPYPAKWWFKLLQLNTDDDVLDKEALEHEYEHKDKCGKSLPLYQFWYWAWSLLILGSSQAKLLTILNMNQKSLK